ncbi:MAG: hypothetical protein GY845_16605 [Planctomycetes bacterium]|nr:hypothetical protein [Planctomycetota bacterium]
MKKIILVISLALAVVLVSTCTKREPEAEEGKSNLKFEVVKERENIFALSTQYLTSGTDKPAELKDLPKGVTADYVYFLPKLAGRNTPAVLSSYSTLKQSILYVDTNSDGHLSDEKGYGVRIVQRPEFKGQEYRFGPISAECSDSGKKLETSFFAVTYHGRQLILYPEGYYAGEVRLGEKSYKVAIIDGNFDGRYGKIFSPPVESFYRPECDLFAIDRTGDNKLSWEHQEVMPLAKMVKLQNAYVDNYYSIAVAPDGSSLELKKMEPEFGTLDLGGAHVNFQLWSDAARQILNDPPNTNWQLPAGIYSTSPIELRHVDTSGNRWIFRTSRENLGKLKNFEITAGQTTMFRIGPPFSIKTSVEQRGEFALIGFSLEGQSGDCYTPGARKGRATAPEPKFEIVDEAGKILESGRFKYG